MVVDVLIVGAGISGLAAAAHCYAVGLNVVVVEALDVIGGRVKSATHDSRYVGDLGPSWVWPPWQSVATRWLSELNVDTFPQFEAGDGLLDFPGKIERYPLPGQHGIARLVGGPESIVTRLASRVEGKILCGWSLQKLVAKSDCIEAQLQVAGSEDKIVQARHVILAVPMRVAQESIQFDPVLPLDVRQQMTDTPTWMAAQVKVVAHYAEPFWRHRGLSGRVASRVGPLVEIHDHCDAQGSPAALFGFMGLTVAQRQKHREELSSMVTEQLLRCFGEQASAYMNLWIEDWSLARTICSTADREGGAAHPELRPDCLRQPQMGGRLHFASAEVAVESPGLIDGALQAGEAAATAVERSR